MSTDVEKYEPTTTVTTVEHDPTGGRLIAWAKAARAAHDLAVSLVQTSFVPTVRDKRSGQQVPLSVGDATAMILTGDELGFSPLTALRSVYLVHGTPALYAKAMSALVMSQGHDLWVVEETPAKVTVGGKRRGSEHEQFVTWTMDRARKAGYVATNKKYATHPQEMLYARCVSDISKRIAPDVIAGIPSVEELELDQEPATTTVTRESATKRMSRSKPEPEEPPLDESPRQESPDDATQGVAAPGVEPVEGEDAGTSLAPHAEDEPPLDDAPQGGVSSSGEEGSPEVVTAAQLKNIGRLMTKAEITERVHALAFVGSVIGREIDSRKELTKSEAHDVIESLMHEVGEA